MTSVVVRSVLAVAVVALAASPSALARDYAGFARNVIPSGQYGAVPPPPEADDQALMYDRLTPLFGSVRDSDLIKYFKPETFGTRGQGPTRREAVPRPGVRIVRDRWNVPHIIGKTRADVAWGAGWVTIEDRYLLIGLARNATALAALDVPGLDPFGVALSGQRFEPSRQTEAFLARQTGLLRRQGRKGRQLLRDIDAYIAGGNAYYRATDRPDKPLTRNDVYAVNAFAGRLFGRGGGDEASRSMFLDSLEKRLGRRRGTSVWTDLRERLDPEAPVTIEKSFPYQNRLPRRRTGNRVLDAGSFRAWDSAPAASARARTAVMPSPPHASNFLMVGAKRSATGHPLFVAGPQIGYFYPGLTLEMDLHGGGIDTRGASAPGFPGYMLIGRGQDFAWSLTSAGNDMIDEYVETLCGSDTRYRYKGRCRPMGTFNAGTLAGRRVSFRTTVHGPVTGYATVGGKRVAITEKRSSRGRDILWQLLFQDLSMNRPRGARQFLRSAASSPFTFNVAYADDRDIAMFSAGRLPIRAPGVDPSLPTDGRGAHEWRGFLPARRHPQQINPKSGVLVNWNNKPARNFPAADDQWGYGSIYRSDMLSAGLAKRRRHTLATVVSAMNQAATTDYRVAHPWPVVADVLRKGGLNPPSVRARRMYELLNEWRGRGASRLDRALDGKIDHPGAAIIDAAWPRITDAVLSPVLGPLVNDPTGMGSKSGGPTTQFIGGRGWYVHKDLRTLLGRRVKGRYANRYCGRGKLAPCKTAIWAALEAAGAELAAAQGLDPAAWRADATAERMHFDPGVLGTTMRFANRPSGIQQVLWFKGHRRR